MLCAVGIDLVFLSPYASARMPALLLTSFIWALSFGLLGNCLSGLPASFVALARMAGSFAVFLPFVRKAPLSHAVGMMGIGAVQFGGMYLFYIAAFHYLPSHQVALFTATTPIYVVLIDGLMKKNLPPLHLAAAILAAMGGAGILWKGYSSGNGELTGIVLVQLSNLCFAAGQIAYISLKNSWFGRSEASCFAYAYAGALLVTLPSGLLAGDFNRAMVAADLFGRHRFRSLFFPVELRRAPGNSRKAGDYEQSQDSPGGHDFPAPVQGAFQHVPSVHRLPAYPGLFPDRPYFLKKRRIK